MGASSKTGKFAVGFSVVAFILVFISFVSPYWLVYDGELDEPKFLNLGLWEVCFKEYKDYHRFYDYIFRGCMWVFEEEYYIIHDYLLPGFYVATQFFFTLCFTLMLVGIIMTLAFLKCSRDDDRYVFLLLTNGVTHLAGGFCGLLAVIIFGARGDGRDWMPHWQNNGMGWAFALACIGVLHLFPAGILFMVEARRERYKKLNEISTREASTYSGEESSRKFRGVHTDI